MNFISLFLTILLLSLSSPSLAEDTSEIQILKQRITTLENYLESFSRELSSSLQNYSVKMQESIDAKLGSLNARTVILDPADRAYQKIETNSGYFLIAIDHLESLPDGYRVYFNIGNPNYAEYKNFKIKLYWGKKWSTESAVSFDQWRQSLKGIEVSFNGTLQRGTWSQVPIDLTPASVKSWGYIECELIVNSVEMELKKNDGKK